MNITIDLLREKAHKVADQDRDALRIILGTFGASCLPEVAKCDYGALDVKLYEWLQAHPSESHSRAVDDGPIPTGGDDDEVTTPPAPAPAVKPKSK